MLFRCWSREVLAPLLLASLQFVASGCAIFDCGDEPLEGAYLFQYTSLDEGGCGALGDEFLVLSGAPDCAAVEARVAEDNCSSEVELTCTNPATERQVRSTISIQRTTPDGTRIDGVLIRTVDDQNGGFFCTSSYEFTAEKV
jgi:hypothetical protein